MSKYSLEFKLKAIMYYMDNYKSVESIAKELSISSPTSLKKWIRKYKLYGIDGLKKQEISSYSGSFKKKVVEYMHNHHLSLTETGIQYNITTDTVLKWEKIYCEEGPQALYEERRGSHMRKKTEPNKEEKISKAAEKDLLAEIEQLRMENEYLKKLNALVQERIKQENKKK